MNFCTYAGRQFDPMRLGADDIELSDIVRSLAMQPRFLGHTTTHYSVAEHSVNVARLVGLDDENAELDEDVILAALLHDASEAYLGDLPTPLKRHLPDYLDLEATISQQIAKKFDCPFPWPEAVLNADARMLVTEARDFGSSNWPVSEVAAATGVLPLNRRLRTPLSPQKAMLRFAYAFEDLVPEAGDVIREFEDEVL